MTKPEWANELVWKLAVILWGEDASRKLNDLRSKIDEAIK